MSKRITRILEPFDDFRNKEVVYCGINAAILHFEKVDPKNAILSLLWNALAHRAEELKDHYESQKYRERNDG